MKTYQVGGSVRDELLGMEPHDKDWVVVGSSPEEMIEAGFKPIGKDFPVFLHPDTKEEYALARTERKSGKGYHGFKFYYDPSVTLEDDLLRRDLTINAIAKDSQGKLIDPFNGQDDLFNKKLRNVSNAFCEDPLRAIRLGRFLSYKHISDFSITPQLKAIVKKILYSGELNYLSGDRVFAEIDKAMQNHFPEKFFNFVVENKLDKPWLKDINSLDSFSATSSDLRWVELSCLNHFTDFDQIPLPSKIKKLISLARQLANIKIDNILIDNIDSLRILRNEEDIMRIVSLGLECMDQKLITKIVHLYKDINFAELEKLDPNERKNEKINLLKDLVSKL